MNVEGALRWAFREELSKTGALNRDETDAPRHVTLKHRDRGDVATTVQMLVEMPCNCYGVLRRSGASQPPHPDAILTGDAVMALDATTIAVPDDWKPLAEMDDLSPEVTRHLRVAVKQVAHDINGDRGLYGVKPSHLARRSALSGVAPDWRAQVPTVEVETNANGKPRWFVTVAMRSKAFGENREAIEDVEVDGFDQTARRPRPGAYQKIYLDSDPESAIRARAEYELWYSALGQLYTELAPLLTTIRLEPTPRPEKPRIEGDYAPSVLPDLSDMRSPW